MAEAAQRNPKMEAFLRNVQWALAQPKDHGYATQLEPHEEQAFRAWVQENNVPFDSSPQADYDMRGFWKALMAKDPRAATAVNPNDKAMHYPDYWKTPYHESFSNESQWATDKAPSWNDKDQLVSPAGAVVFDEKAKARGKK